MTKEMKKILNKYKFMRIDDSVIKEIKKDFEKYLELPVEVKIIGSDSMCSSSVIKNCGFNANTPSVGLLPVSIITSSQAFPASVLVLINNLPFSNSKCTMCFATNTSRFSIPINSARFVINNLNGAFGKIFR